VHAKIITELVTWLEKTSGFHAIIHPLMAHIFTDSKTCGPGTGKSAGFDFFPNGGGVPHGFLPGS
jgi:hypothetical protein